MGAVVAEGIDDENCTLALRRPEAFLEAIRYVWQLRNVRVRLADVALEEPAVERVRVGRVGAVSHLDHRGLALLLGVVAHIDVRGINDR